MSRQHQYVNSPVRLLTRAPQPYDPLRDQMGRTPNRGSIIRLPHRADLLGLRLPHSLAPNGSIGSVEISNQNVPGNNLFGFPKISPKVLNLDLATAATAQIQAVQGSVLWLNWASTSTALIQVQFNEQSDPLKWGPGNGVEGIPFDKVILTWAAQAGVTAQLAYFLDSVDRPIRFF